MTELQPPTPPPPPPGRNYAEELPYSFRNRVVEMFTKRELQRKQRRYGGHHLIAGTSAGVATTVALYPLDLVKTRYQVCGWLACIALLGLQRIEIVPSHLALLLVVAVVAAACHEWCNARVCTWHRFEVDVP